MSKEKLFEETVEMINRLPDEKLLQVHDFIAFLLSKIDDGIIQENLQALSSQSKTLRFLDEEEDLYTVNDLKYLRG